VNNTNLYPILHCFQVTADYWSNFYFSQAGNLFNTLVRGESLTQIYKIWQKHRSIILPARGNQLNLSW